MTDYHFRVRLAPVTGGQNILCEKFNSEAEAQAYFDAMQNPDQGGVLDKLPFDAVTLSFEELYNGDWTSKCDRLLTK